MQYNHHIINDMLNKAYGKFGRTFRNKDEAEGFKKIHPGSILTRLISYHPQQLEYIEHAAKPKDGCKPMTSGWLVTLPASWKDMHYGY